MMKADVAVQLRSGETSSAEFDAGEPESDLALQARKVEAKFDALVQPVLGGERAARLKSRILGIEGEASIAGLLAASHP
jgi:hypothetical protein